jgi:hypothetical protein
MGRRCGTLLAVITGQKEGLFTCVEFFCWPYSSPPAAAPVTPKAPDVDVNVNRTERHVISFANPTVLAVGAGVLVLLVVLIAMASRGGGTTIIKEK